MWTTWMGVGGAAALLSVASLSGCSEPEPPPVAEVKAPPPPPPPPAKPKAKTLEQLMAELGIDPRVQLEEDGLPSTTEARIALLEFLDSFARGDAEALSPMLSSTDRYQLDQMTDTGEWSDATANISLIRAKAGKAPASYGGGNVVLAVFEVGDEIIPDYEPQLWTFDESAGEYTFEAVPCPPEMMNKLSGADRIQAWFQILDDEKALAAQPDEELIVNQQDASDAEDEEEEADEDGGNRPRTPGGMRGRRKQKSPFR